MKKKLKGIIREGLILSFTVKHEQINLNCIHLF